LGVGGWGLGFTFFICHASLFNSSSCVTRCRDYDTIKAAGHAAAAAVKAGDLQGIAAAVALSYRAQVKCDSCCVSHVTLLTPQTSHLTPHIKTSFPFQTPHTPYTPRSSAKACVPSPTCARASQESIAVGALEDMLCTCLNRRVIVMLRWRRRGT